MPRQILVLVAMLFLSAAARLHGAVTTADFKGSGDVGDPLMSYTANGVTTPYRLYTPAGLQAGTRYPLVVFLHGYGERGSDNHAQLTGGCQGSWNFLSDANQAKQKCFFLAPQCTVGVGWDNTGDTRANDNVAAIVQQLSSSLAIDANRIYLTGISGGGGGVFCLLGIHANLFACAIPQSANNWTGDTSSYRDLPLWCFHAQDDTTVGYNWASDPAIADMRRRGGNPVYTLYWYGGHGIWPTAYATPPLFDWMVAQRRGVPAAPSPAVVIGSPTNATAWTTSSTTASFSGSASSDALVSGVRWDYTNSDGSEPGYQQGNASGTSSWSFGPVSLRTNATVRMRVTASGTSWSANLAGGTTFSDTVIITQQAGAANTAPTVSKPANQTANANAVIGPVAVTVGDVETSAGALALSASSSNTALLPASGVALGGSGGARTVTLTPSAGQTGSSTVTLTVTDGSGASATSTFIATWNAIPDTTAPVVTITSPSSAPSYTATSATIAIGGSASDAVGVASVAWSCDRGGSGAASGTTSWSASVALQSGANVITVTARDAANNASTDTITVSWTPPANTGTFSAQYYATVDLSGAAIAATVPAIDFDWGYGAPAGMPTDNFSARWTGTATPTTSGTYTFYTTTDDGVNLWVGGQRVISHWIDQGPTEYAVDIALTAGVPVAITMEYYERGGGATAKLYWSSAGVAKQPVPPSGSAGYRFLVDFGVATRTTAGWNNITDPTAGSVMAVSDAGVATGAQVRIIDGFAGTNEYGVNVDARYPATASADTFWLGSGKARGEVVLANLSPTLVYDIKAFGSRSQVSDDRSTLYTIGSASRTLNAANNSSATADFIGVVPAADGTIHLVIAPGATSTYGYGYLNVLEVVARVSGSAAATDVAMVDGQGSGRCGLGTGLAVLLMAGLALLRPRARLDLGR